MRLAPLARFLLLGGVLASAAHAQSPRALNAPPLPSAEAERLSAFEALLGRGGPTPDTTAPWRYYPLHVGNAWEYATFDGRTVYRREINRDTVYLGRRYSVVDRYVARDGGPIEPDGFEFLRFDTLSALVYEPNGSGGERVTNNAPCPFDAAFNSTVECPGWGVSPDFFVVGGYAGLLVFGGTIPGTGEDTVSTAWKEYTWEAEVWRYGADFGEIYHAGEVEAPYGLYFARVDGVEHGVERYPVSAESPPEPQPAALSVWPNPARGRTRVAFTPEAGGPALLTVHDLQGRRVLTREVTAPPGVRAEVGLDLAGLAPGVYAVRLGGARGAVLLTVLP